jgi:hypothetical protein
LQTEVTQNEASTISSLRALVQDFLARHPRVTVQALAQRAQVPVTSLRRLMQEESKSEVAPHTALNLCAYICREKRVGELLKLLPPVLAEFLQKYFGGFVFEGSEKRVYSVDLNEALKDRMSYFIYKLAANSAGTSWMEVTELFGSTGKRKAEDMLKQELIKEVDGRLSARDRDFSLDLQVASAHLPELVKFYRPESVGRGLNLMYSLSESLNEDAIKKIKDVQREAVKATHAIMQDSANHGDVPYFTLNLCETFLAEPEGELQ